MREGVEVVDRDVDAGLFLSSRTAAMRYAASSTSLKSENVAAGSCAPAGGRWLSSTRPPGNTYDPAMNATLSLRRTIRISNGFPSGARSRSRPAAAAIFGGTMDIQLCGEFHKIADMIERKDTDGIRVLKLAHGKVSAMDIELGEALTREIADAAAAPIKAVIVTGSGSSFSAGVDLYRVVNDGPEYGRRFLPVLDAFLHAA